LRRIAKRALTVDTSNPFIARWIPKPDESMVVIRFRNPRGIDFACLVAMIHGSSPPPTSCGN
jgi:phosphoribulokinase